MEKSKTERNFGGSTSTSTESWFVSVMNSQFLREMKNENSRNIRKISNFGYDLCCNLAHLGDEIIAKEEAILQIIAIRSAIISHSVMPNIILKKTFKVKPSGFQVAAEKSFSLHGSAVTQQIVNAINQKLSSLRTTSGAGTLQFKLNNMGHYSVQMNHNFQKFFEEDAVCAILDVMEILGWNFRFQYDSESSSMRVNGSSMTSRELFIFTKDANSSF